MDIDAVEQIVWVQERKLFETDVGEESSVVLDELETIKTLAQGIVDSWTSGQHSYPIVSGDYFTKAQRSPIRLTRPRALSWIAASESQMGVRLGLRARFIVRSFSPA